jgi:hypothetical protein
MPTDFWDEGQVMENQLMIKTKRWGRGDAAVRGALLGSAAGVVDAGEGR